MTRIAVVGAGGRMGRSLVEAVQQQNGVELAAAVDRPGSEAVGRDAGELAGIGPLGVAVVDDLEQVIDRFDVLIDFTLPEATVAHAAICRRHGRRMVVGTTGFSAQQRADLNDAARDIALVVAPNMSVGV
ncbi:MAG TPA: 4-hydroxy-tetrahydrodipicolinate reductase, partial [Mycobacterium sp.]|nr:4-hydroxy-tetrahydrodipicolinate reductase [Mycobacterium sp.]